MVDSPFQLSQRRFQRVKTHNDRFFQLKPGQSWSELKPIIETALEIPLARLRPNRESKTTIEFIEGQTAQTDVG